MRAAAVPLSVLVLAASLISACSGGGGDGPEDSPDGSPLAAKTVREWAGIRLTLSVDRDEYEVGKPVKIRAEAENVRAERILFRPISPELPLLRLALKTEVKGTVEFSGGRVEGGEGNALAPGATLVREFEWDQQFPTYQTPVQAPAGTYEISAQVIVSPDEVSRPDAVATVVRFRLDGGKPIVASEVAIETALVHDEVKRWFDGREGGGLVCADGNRGAFFLVDTANAAVSEAFSDLYQTQVERGRPICSPVTEGDTWRVIFSARGGPEPRRISAFVDLHDASFLRVEEGGPGGTP